MPSNSGFSEASDSSIYIPSPKIPKELIVLRLVDVLLNKVQGLNWNYFEINLNDVTSTNSDFFRNMREPKVISTNVEGLLNDIKGDSSGALKYLPKTPKGISAQHKDSTELKSKDILNILKYTENNSDILTKAMSRIFDINIILDGNNVAIEDALSSASVGWMGKLNLQEKERRDKAFREVFRKNPSFREDSNNFVVLAEGDSWFCFPRIYLPIRPFKFTRRLLRDPVKDIIDNLIRKKNLAIYSLAAGGDWLNNMLDNNAREFIEPLNRIAPDVFLVSGGGNDMVSNDRIAYMVLSHIQIKENEENPDNSRDEKRKKIVDKLWANRQSDKLLENTEYKKLYKRGLDLVSEDFFRFINGCLVQYFTLFFKVLKNTDKFKHMLIITQGYDFAIPSMDKKGNFLSWQKLLKKNMNNGRWMYDPLVLKGIHNEFDQKAAVFTMIYEFNEMLASIARYKEFPNVFHLDIRGFSNQDDWFDELHLKSKPYKKISDKIYEIIKKYSPILKEGNLKLDVQEKVITM